MSALIVLLMYIGMLAFDFAVLAGSVYMVADKGWSAWWILAAVIICGGSNPRTIIATWRGVPAAK